ncbi:MAG: SUMF1/EgtB/PvdO family nonheme iron enzyme [Candidatus Delongbacteria bacterium]
MSAIVTFLTGLLGSLTLAFALEAPVVGISAIAGLDSVYVNLNWSPVPGATSYSVYYQPRLAEPATLLGKTRAASFLTAVPNGWTWYQQPDVLGFYSVASDSAAMILIPAGQFIMGQAGVAMPEHSVTLTHSFLLGRTEVTNAQFLEALNWALAQGLVSVVGDFVQQYDVNLLRINDPGYDYCEIRYNTDTQQFYLQSGTFNSGDWGPGFAFPTGYDPANQPVMWVSWYGAACYCDWLSLMAGLPAYYSGWWTNTNSPYTATGYRLPTEAEWEFAAQHDDERTYPWGASAPTCTLANYNNDSYCVGWTGPVSTHPTGASGQGLQDMAGNLWEWCNDWDGTYSGSPQIDPVVPYNGLPFRVLRGGSWRDDAWGLQSAAHGTCSSPSNTSHIIGFRLCSTLQ